MARPNRLRCQLLNIGNTRGPAQPYQTLYIVPCVYSVHIKLLVVRILDIRGEQWRPDLKNLFVLINAHGMQEMGLGVVCCAFSQVLMIYLRCKQLGLSGINILLYFSNTFWLGLFTQRLSGEPFGQPVISENRFGQESFGR